MSKGNKIGTTVNGSQHIPDAVVFSSPVARKILTYSEPEKTLEERHAELAASYQRKRAVMFAKKGIIPCSTCGK